MTGKTQTVKMPPVLTYIEYYILLVLLNIPLHGIGIFEAVVQQTNNQLVLSPGTLYAALKRMYGHGWINMVEPSTAGYNPDERRKIYAVTSDGVHVLEEMDAWLAMEITRVQQALSKRRHTESTSSQAHQSLRSPSTPSPAPEMQAREQQKEAQGPVPSNKNDTAKGEEYTKPSSSPSARTPRRPRTKHRKRSY